MMTAAGVVLALIGVIIAYLAWRGDEGERRNVAGGDASPSIAPSNASGNASSSTPAGPLRYQLDAGSLDDRTVRVAATTSGAPEASTAYWFILEINWGDGNTDYYPRRDLKGDAATFDVTIPADASTDVVRTGKVYALTPAQASQAQVYLDRQANPAADDDFFDNPPGEAKSAGVRLPF
ncbi:hypothetical protein [Paractinoplanes maris]|uniref:hypothetical protein n=1 Tax=Paractinoplanes maris TaxID=1734446 RepID=UPI0020220BBC|nr:hypothetical protein [Actinoplanes maris]